jgi:hypothetical protein
MVPSDVQSSSAKKKSKMKGKGKVTEYGGHDDNKQDSANWPAANSASGRHSKPIKVDKGKGKPRGGNGLSSSLPNQGAGAVLSEYEELPVASKGKGVEVPVDYGHGSTPSHFLSPSEALDPEQFYVTTTPSHEHEETEPVYGSYPGAKF